MIVYNKIEAGLRLSELIAETEKNSRRFAIAIGADPSYISKMEKGQKGISEPYLKKIESKYGINRQWLLFGTLPKYGQNVPRELPETPVKESAATGLDQLSQVIVQLMKTQNHILEQQREDVTDRLKRLEANLNMVVGRSEALQFDLISAREVVLQSLARLEGLSENALLMKADKRKAFLAEAKAEQYKKAAGGR